MEIDGKIYKNGSGKNASFFIKNYFSLEDVSSVKNSDLTVNNTHSQSSVSFSPLDTNGTRPSVGVNYLSDDSFWREEILFLRGKLENKQKTIDKLFNILRNNEITKQFFLDNNSAEKKSENVMTNIRKNILACLFSIHNTISDHVMNKYYVMTNNSVINIDNNSSIDNSTKDQFKSTANTSETLIITEDICNKNKIKNDVNKTTNNNQNLDNGAERVRKSAINVENQFKETRKSMHQRHHNSQRKPNNQNQVECKVKEGKQVA